MKVFVIDIKSLLIGVLITALAASLLYRRHSITSPDIQAHSLTIVDKNRQKQFVITCDESGGYLAVMNKQGHIAAYIGPDNSGHGNLRIYNANGKEIVYGGSLANGNGYIRTYNHDGKPTTHTEHWKMMTG